MQISKSSEFFRVPLHRTGNWRRTLIMPPSVLNCEMVYLPMFTPCLNSGWFERSYTLRG